jgi:hypothetical protein
MAGVSATDVELGRWSRRPPPHAALNVRDAARLFFFCATFRVLNALAVRTYFNADEYWQALGEGCSLGQGFRE